MEVGRQDLRIQGFKDEEVKLRSGLAFQIAGNITTVFPQNTYCYNYNFLAPGRCGY